MATMKTSRIPFLFVLPGLIFVAAGAATSSATDAYGDKKAPNFAADKTPAAALKWAMSNAEVRQVMGQPDEIRSMAAPQGKAEIWVYSRPLSHRIEQMVVGTVPIMSTTYEVNGSCKEKKAGRAIEQKIGETIQYGSLHVRTVEKVEVLLFNQHFVKAKVTQQEVRSYN